MKTVFNRKEIDFSKEPMFFGEDNSVQRYDVFKYPVFDKLNQKMIGYFWRPEEVSLHGTFLKQFIHVLIHTL